MHVERKGERVDGAKRGEWKQEQEVVHEAKDERGQRVDMTSNRWQGKTANGQGLRCRQGISVHDGSDLSGREWYGQ